MSWYDIIHTNIYKDYYNMIYASLTETTCETNVVSAGKKNVKLDNCAAFLMFFFCLNFFLKTYISKINVSWNKEGINGLIRINELFS